MEVENKIFQDYKIKESEGEGKKRRGREGEIKEKNNLRDTKDMA